MVLVAVNRKPDVSYTIPAVQTGLPAGRYADYLGGDLFGTTATVQNGYISSFNISGGVCVWQYEASGDQNQIVFHVTAATQYGENIYIVGNIPELGNWNPNNCTEAMLNPNYPEWLLSVSVPAGTTIEFKFIKKDASGNITWESGTNRTVTSSSNPCGVVDTEVYMWRN